MRCVNYLFLESILLLCSWLVTVRAADYVNMFFAKLFVEKSGGKSLIRADGFVTDRAGATYSRFAGWVTVRAAGNCHKLVGNFHGAENF